MAVAKENELELETVCEDPGKGVSAEYLKINPLGKVPTFQGSDGFVLSECIAIAIYCECCIFPVCFFGDGFFDPLRDAGISFSPSMIERPLWLWAVLTSAIIVASQNEKTTLLGGTKQDYASILRWMSFANSEILPALGGWFRPLIGRDPYNKKSVDTAQANSFRAAGVLEKHLLTRTFLVGERLTLADLFATSIIARGFQYVGLV